MKWNTKAPVLQAWLLLYAVGGSPERPNDGWPEGPGWIDWAAIDGQEQDMCQEHREADGDASVLATRGRRRNRCLPYHETQDESAKKPQKSFFEEQFTSSAILSLSDWSDLRSI